MAEETVAPDKMNFETALGQLEELVAKMESGKLPLENMISDFERGTRLINVCRSRLDSMQRKIEILMRDDGQGGEWADFEPDTPPRNAPPPQQQYQQSGDLPF